MRFEEAYNKHGTGALTEAEAALLLGVCERTFRRYMKRYEEGGLEALLDKRLTQASHRRAPVDEVMRLVENYRSRHMGWNAKHFMLGTAKRAAVVAIRGLRVDYKKLG